MSEERLPNLRARLPSLRARPRPPTDLRLLKAIYDRHRHEFPPRPPLTDRAGIFVPIDIPGIAEQLGVDTEIVFGRLYYHLDPKYAEPEQPGKPRKMLFAPVAGDERNCINWPLLEAVLAGLWQERNLSRRAFMTAAFSTGIALASLFVSLLR